MGGEFYDLGRGRLTRIWMVSVPVRDLEAAMEYYRDVLGLEIHEDARAQNRVEMGWKGGEDRLALYVPNKTDQRQPGSDTGLVFATDSVFELHRRLVDEGVNFILKPERQPWGGLMAIFEDLDGNRFTVLDDTEHYRKTAAVPAVPDSGITIRTIVTK
jgi:predicted enzyme related to lactoylglutathione lyase